MTRSTAARWLVWTCALLGAAGSLAVVGVSRYSTAVDHLHFRIEGGSMEPTLSIGDTVTVRTTETPKVGDVITFMHDGRAVTHRVVRLWNATDPSGRRHTMYRTKGDANRNEDPWVLVDGAVVGVVSPMSPMTWVAVELSARPIVLAALFAPLLLGIAIAEMKNLKNGIRALHEGTRECPERESNPQDVSIRGV